MAEESFRATIEGVLGGMSEEQADAIVEYWSGNGVFTEEEARERLSEVVCVLVAESGEIVGVNSAYGAGVELIGDRPFWIYSSYLRPEAADADSAMINAAFEALEANFDPAGSGPIGLCVPLADLDEIARRREVIWDDTQLMYAGYLEDGRQLRIRYFDEAAVGPPLPNSPTLAETKKTEYPLDERYSIEPLAESDVSHEDILALWARETAMPDAEAQRRVHEVHLVAVERDEGVVGISSAYLQRNEQLRMDLLHYRAFVSKDHRMSSLAVLLAIQGREVLEERFTSGEDTSAGGVIYVVQNPGLKAYFNKALWMPTDFWFIGDNKRGDHVRVHYFPGALAPAPSQ